MLHFAVHFAVASDLSLIPLVNQGWSAMSSWRGRTLRSNSTTSAASNIENAEDVKLALMEAISDRDIIKKLESVFKPITDTITKAINQQYKTLDALRSQLEA